MQSGEREGERQRETASAKDGLFPPSSQSGGTDAGDFLPFVFFITLFFSSRFIRWREQVGYSLR
jgi:hypothetical protein